MNYLETCQTSGDVGCLPMHLAYGTGACGPVILARPLAKQAPELATLGTSWSPFAGSRQRHATRGAEDILPRALEWVRTDKSAVRARFEETAATYWMSPFLSAVGEASVMPARRALREAANSDVANRAGRILDLMATIIGHLQLVRSDVRRFPPVRAFNLDDSSTLIEWIFPDFRVGFSIDSNAEDSSWYIVSNENLGYIMQSGYISDSTIGMLVFGLMKFVHEHS